MRRPSLLFLLFALTFIGSAAVPRRLSVGYAVMGDRLTQEDSAVAAWGTHHSLLTLALVPLASPQARVPPCDVLWVHLPDSASYGVCLDRERQHHALAAFLRKGGKLLCTDFAALLPNDLGIEPVRATVRFDTLKNDWLWDKKGFQSLRGHPILAGMFGGEFVWDAPVDQVLPIVGYYNSSWPALGKVAAVEKSYVFIHADRRTVVEWKRPESGVLAVGGCVYFARANALRRNMEHLVENAILYLGGAGATVPITTWEPCDGIPRSFAVTTQPLPPSPDRILLKPSTSGLVLTREKPGNQFFDLAGRRALIMGRENGGIDEVWIHPFRVLRDFQAGIVTGDSVAWLAHMPVSVTVRPESFTRTYSIPSGIVTEMIFPSFKRAGGVVHYASTVPVRLVIRFRADLRWMWPYDANALGNMYFGYDKALGALHVKDSTGTFACLFGADRAPVTFLAGHYGSIDWTPQGLQSTPTAENQVAYGGVFDLAAGNGRVLNFAFAGTNEGTSVAREDYRALLGQPAAALDELAKHYHDLLGRSLSIASPDDEFNRLFAWAIVGADRFVARTPGLGTGLLAGFSTVNRGWNGAHRISGRPGYAWYFGRDAAWSCLALNGYGDFETVRHQLELYQRFQDPSGKIYHELMTSGVVHFDAADATPLYVILAGHYLRASGDAAFIKASWPHIQRAMEFMYTTDTDGDGLIENTGIGHGWMEPGGSLFGVHTEMHLTVLWAQALRDAAGIAGFLGKDQLRNRFSADADNVQKILNRDFWNPSTGYFNHGKFPDGSYNTERTALTSAGALFGLLDNAKARPMLEALAGNAFTTNWGVRILNSGASAFNPRSYQEGSVWPVMTGWTALGEYAYGHSAQAFAHLMDVMLIENLWSAGFVQEVMNGAVNRPVGVCPHQCWSETGILHPAIEGMVGWKPDAPHASATLMPRFPVTWDSVTVSRLHLGRTVLNFTMVRSRRTTTFTLRRQAGPPCMVNLAPEVPAGMEINSIAVNGVPVTFDRVTERGVLRTPIPLRIGTVATVRLDHTGGIGMAPLVMRPEPGDSAAGVRIVSASLNDGTYSVVVEGLRGTSAVLPFVSFESTLPSVLGGRIRPGVQPGTEELLVDFPQSGEQVQRLSVRFQLR